MVLYRLLRITRLSTCWNCSRFSIGNNPAPFTSFSESIFVYANVPIKKIIYSYRKWSEEHDHFDHDPTGISATGWNQLFDGVFAIAITKYTGWTSWENTWQRCYQGYPILVPKVKYGSHTKAGGNDANNAPWVMDFQWLPCITLVQVFKIPLNHFSQPVKRMSMKLQLNWLFLQWSTQHTGKV